MPGFAKSPPELVERFHAVTDDLPDVQHRLMFGYPALFVAGNMATGLYESSWFVRLGDADRTELLEIDGAGPVEIMPGRSMAGYVALPPSMIADDEPALRSWLARAVAFAQALPPRATRPRRRSG
ncbi:MAG: TfoX/Sxy family protein [Chloroflexi bacterium]|nr:TfoX/Sxy family protein [Chloroflexota bacterium]